MMENARETLSTEIVDHGIEGSGPYAGSQSFSVKVRRGLPDFLNSVNLKYVKLGYGYLISHGFYLFMLPVVLLIFSIVIGKLNSEDFSFEYDITNAAYLIGLLSMIGYVCTDLMPRSVYLVDFSCYRPPNELKISKKEYINLARKSMKFNEKALTFQERVLKSSGMGDETYLPRTIFDPNDPITLKHGREEAAQVIFGSVDALLSATRVRARDIRILIVNCGILNTTPSLSAMLINHYKLGHNVQSYNLGGMGCAGGIVAIDLAKDLLGAYPGSYALVVSTEVVSSSWYDGNDFSMLLPNCFLRMGGAAMLLSNRVFNRWHAKYELKQLVRTHKGQDDKSYKSIQMKEDPNGNLGISVSKDVIEVGGHALKANITTLSPLVLPVSEQFRFFTSLLLGNKTSNSQNSNSKKPYYIPDYKLAFEHICILATSKKVLDEIQKNLELSEEYMECSRKTLERFGNTSSSSVWYELAYLEANAKVKTGDRVCQIAFGSGFKCNSVVWKTLKSPKTKNNSPWFGDDKP